MKQFILIIYSSIQNEIYSKKFKEDFKLFDFVK